MPLGRPEAREGYPFSGVSPEPPVYTRWRSATAANVADSAADTSFWASLSHAEEDHVDDDELGHPAGHGPVAVAGLPGHGGQDGVASLPEG